MPFMGMQQPPIYGPHLSTTDANLSPGARRARENINKMYDDAYRNQWARMQQCSVHPQVNEKGRENDRNLINSRISPLRTRMHAMLERYQD